LSKSKDSGFFNFIFNHSFIHKETFRDLSKPIGALNEKRLEMLRQRAIEMDEDDDKVLNDTCRLALTSIV